MTKEEKRPCLVITKKIKHQESTTRPDSRQDDKVKLLVHPLLTVIVFVPWSVLALWTTSRDEQIPAVVVTLDQSCTQLLEMGFGFCGVREEEGNLFFSTNY